MEKTKVWVEEDGVAGKYIIKVGTKSCNVCEGKVSMENEHQLEQEVRMLKAKYEED